VVSLIKSDKDIHEGTTPLGDAVKATLLLPFLTPLVVVSGS